MMDELKKVVSDLKALRDPRTVDHEFRASGRHIFRRMNRELRTLSIDLEERVTRFYRGRRLAYEGASLHEVGARRLLEWLNGADDVFDGEEMAPGGAIAALLLSAMGAGAQKVDHGGPTRLLLAGREVCICNDQGDTILLGNEGSDSWCPAAPEEAFAWLLEGRSAETTAAPPTELGDLRAARISQGGQL